LRGLAIIGVVLYSWKNFLPGGHYGADIFFVISGYVISQTMFQ